MGLVYTLSITSFSKGMFSTQSSEFNLIQYLKDRVNTQKNSLIELLIFEDGNILFSDRKIVQKDIPFDFEDIEFYTFLKDGSKKEYFGYYEENDIEREILFRFQIFPNSSSTVAIVKIEEDFYTYFSYFKDIKKFSRLDEAKEYLFHKDLSTPLMIADE